MSKLAKLVGVILTFSLNGCTSITCPDTNVDSAKNNRVTLKEDAVDCARSYPEVDSGAHIKQRISCMNLKGWN